MKRILALCLVLFTNLLFAQTQVNKIDLPSPQKTGGMPLMEVLAKRSTARAFSSKELSTQQISNLLWAAFGINRLDGKRTAPSARNCQETDIYILMKSGAFIYNAKENRLINVAAGDLRAFGGTQEFAKDAPITLVFVADLSKLSGTLEDKRCTANIDAGYISQNVYLYRASEGLVTGARASVDQKLLAPKINLRADQLIIIAHSVGYPKEK